MGLIDILAELHGNPGLICIALDVPLQRLVQAELVQYIGAHVLRECADQVHGIVEQVGHLFKLVSAAFV